MNGAAPTGQPPGFAARHTGDIRQDPSLHASQTGANPVPPTRDAAHEHFADQPPWLQQSGPQHRNPISRVAFMFGVFAIGAIAGLAATWWMTRAADAPATASVRKFEPVARTQAPNSANRAALAPPTGINPGELPYDGAPPGAAEKTPPAAAMAMTKAQPDPRISDSGTAAKAAPNAAAIVAPPPPEKRAQTVIETPAGSRVDAPTTAQKKNRDRKVAKAASTHRASPRAVQDGEIERITQQAAEELKKKTRNRAVVRQSHSNGEKADQGAPRQVKEAATSSSGGHSKRAMLARCENASNFILRERCKWQVCSGMWGKNGCPSYERQASVDY